MGRCRGVVLSGSRRGIGLLDYQEFGSLLAYRRQGAG